MGENSYEKILLNELDIQNREMQRDEFVAELINNFSQDYNDYLKLCLIINDYLIQRSKGIDNPSAFISKEGIFFESVLGRIRKFSKTKTEGDAMIAQLLNRVTKKATYPFYRNLLKEDFL